MLSEKHNSFLRLLKKKGFKEERMTKIGLYTIATFTTLESNKSRGGRLKPQGCPRARASGRPVVAGRGRMTKGWHRRTRASYGAATRTSLTRPHPGSWA